jgi:hypothetical protein
VAFGHGKRVGEAGVGEGCGVGHGGNLSGHERLPSGDLNHGLV